MAEPVQFDFRTKYLKTNVLSRWLLGGFFGNLSLMLKKAQPSSVLEVGCGEGFSTIQMRKILGPQVHLEASDVEDRLVEAAKAANPTVQIRRESAYELERPDRSVDLVVMLEVLEHLDNPAKALEQVCRVSRNWILLSVPNEPLWRMMNMARLKYCTHLGNTPGHVQHWSAGSFRQFVQAQAQVELVAQPLPWTMVLAKVRQGQA